MRIQNLVLCAIAAITLATAVSAQQVVVVSEGEAEGAGFFQPYENRAHPNPTEGDDFNDDAGGTKSLKVTLTDTGYVANPGVGNPPSANCNDTVTPSCGGFGGVAYEKAGVTDSIADIAPWVRGLLSLLRELLVGQQGLLSQVLMRSQAIS